MKKPLFIFIVFIAILVFAKTIYNKYCESKVNGCKKQKIDHEKDGFPKKGIDW